MVAVDDEGEFWFALMVRFILFPDQELAQLWFKLELILISNLYLLGKLPEAVTVIVWEAEFG